ncbi:MAG TPA: hypothetical protein ENJ28_06365 [Gammaproteobacteria bacterium]|nr:hypothetical protein [Gammaproteobacteria bacterium]
MKQIKGRHLIMGLCLSACSLEVSAISIQPGNAIFLSGTTVLTNPELGGTVINDNIDGFFKIEPESPLFSFGQQYQNRVVRSEETGTVIIAPRLRDPFNVTGGQALIDGFSINGYAGWEVDVNYRSDGVGDKGPTFVDRSADGDVLTFTFGFPLVINNLFGEIQEESFFINILTDAPKFITTGRATLFGRNLDYPDEFFEASIGGIAVPSSADVNAAPVPASALLFGSGLLGLVGMVRRKHDNI